VLVVSETVFETRAIPVWHIIIFAILSPYMIIFVSAIVKGWREWLMIFGFFSFFGSLFFLFLFSILFSKIKVYEDGISFRMYHVYFDEISRIKLRWGGRLMTYGKKLDLGYILLNPNKFVEAVKAVKPEVLVEYRKPARRWKPLIYSLIPLASLMVLGAIEYALGCIGVVIDPFAWALVGGVVVALSTAAWVYWLPPHRYRILGLGRLGTSVAVGSAIGIPVFLIMLTRLFL
jgi:hypothetical protein